VSKIKINHKFKSKFKSQFKLKLCAVDGGNKKISPKTTSSALKMLILFFIF